MHRGAGFSSVSRWKDHPAALLHRRDDLLTFLPGRDIFATFLHRRAALHRIDDLATFHRRAAFAGILALTNGHLGNRNWRE